MALLDQIFGSPSDQALYALGSGLLGVRRGDEGRAFQMAMGAYNQAQQEQRKNKLTDAQQRLLEMQIKEHAQKVQDAQAVRDWYSKPENVMIPAKPAVPWGTGMTGGLDQQDINPGSPSSLSAPLSPRVMGQKMMASGNPALVQQGFQMIQKSPPIHMKEGEQLRDSEDPTKILASNPKQQAQWVLAPDVKLPSGQMAMRNLTTGDVKAVGSGPLVTNILPGQEKAENAAVGKFWGEQYGDIQKSGLNAGGKISRLDRIEQLLAGVETGKLTPAATDIQALGKSIGIDIGDVSKLDSKQAASALSKEMAMQMRNPAGGAGMPGAMSDADRKFLEQTVPGLSQTPGGNKLIIETNRRLAKRDQQVSRFAAAYRQKNGQLDEGFVQELQKWSEANPLFGDLATVPAGSGLRYIGPAK